MSRRIDVELTSTRDDGTWTWRAAGAKQPKGVLDGSLLYPGAKVGDVIKAEADFEIEGIFIRSVLPPKTKDDRADDNRLRIIGPPRAPREGVTTELTGRSERDRRDRRPPREGDRDRRPRDRDRDPARGQRAPRGERSPSLDDRPRRDRPDGARTERPTGTRPGGERRPPRQERAPRPAPEPRPKPKKLNPANTHRAAVLESLSPEQRPIAEQFLKGGLPAVRQAVDAQNAAAKAEDAPEIPAAPVMAIAEAIAPRLKAAEWLDRAEAAARAVDEISIRDLRSVVATSDAARDDQARELAATLRTALERRLGALQQQWLSDVTAALDEDRLVRALRIAGRPPEPGSRLPAEVATRLTDAASAALAPDTAPERWAVLLDAIASSPVRRTVKPTGLPAEPGEALLQAAKEVAGRIPAVAKLLGIEVPPPPAPPRRGGRPARPGGRAAGKPDRSGSPPPPPRRPRPAGAAPGTPPAVTEPGAGATQPAPSAGGDAAEADTATVTEADRAGAPEGGPDDGPVTAAVVTEQAVAAPAEAAGVAAAEPETATVSGADRAGAPEGGPDDGPVTAAVVTEQAVAAPAEAAPDTEASAAGPDTAPAEAAPAAAEAAATGPDTAPAEAAPAAAEAAAPDTETGATGPADATGLDTGPADAAADTSAATAAVPATSGEDTAPIRSAAEVETATVTEQAVAAAGTAPSAGAASEQVASEQVEHLERTPQHHVAGPGNSAAVPSGEGEAASDGVGTFPVVDGVTDEQGALGVGAESVEDRPEPLGAPEIIGEERGGGSPTEAG